MTNSNELYNKLQKEKDEIKAERIKLQALNLERNRIDRNEARRELYYEQVGAACTALPLPSFSPIKHREIDDHISYLCCISDLHYGATFISENNEYSPYIFAERQDYLADKLVDFIEKENLSYIYIACLGDTIQGLIHINDLKINDSSIVKATVEVSRYQATFLNKLSSVVRVSYYHVPSSNHSQLRPFGTKANEIVDEDFEYIVGNYIKDLCANNDRITVNLAEEGKQYIEIPIPGSEVIAMHGHQIKNLESSLKDLSFVKQKFIDYLIQGHYHSGKEIPSSEHSVRDTQILICPSFVGSDPYSDSIMKGSKASVKIFGFDPLLGYTDMHKIILN